MLRTNIKQLEAFRWVAYLGRFQEAASQLNTTQPAISSRIRKLEDLLGVSLFERSERPAILTEKGQELLQIAEQILFLADKFEETAIAPEKRVGTLRIGVSETIVSTWFGEFVSEFRQAHPLVDLDITVDVSIRLREELLSRRRDLCFMLGPMSEYRFENRHLSTFEMAWIAHRELDIQPDGCLTEAEIAKHPILTFPQNTQTFREIEDHFRNNLGLAPSIFPCNSMTSCLRLVSDRIGVACVPLAIAKDAEKRNLRIFNANWLPKPHDFLANYMGSVENSLIKRAVESAVSVSARYATQV